MTISLPNPVIRTWLAPAKINRFLHITGRRPDGYHYLQTLFQFIDLYDELHFVPRSDGAICLRGGLAGLPEHEDLSVRAAKLLREKTGVLAGVDIHLNKHIPTGGGLGGGSSDAATTLIALNTLWRCGLDQSALQSMGLELGADVPVFVFGQAAWAEGIGESLQPVAPDEPWLLLVDPGCHVDTGRIFSSAELTRDCRSITMSGFLDGQSGNVCEAVVRAYYPDVRMALDWLLAHCGNGRLTGTGGCVFACFSERASAAALYHELPDQWRGYVVRARNRSPCINVPVEEAR